MDRIQEIYSCIQEEMFPEGIPPVEQNDDAEMRDVNKVNKRGHNDNADERPKKTSRL